MEIFKKVQNHIFFRVPSRYDFVLGNVLVMFHRARNAVCLSKAKHIITSQAGMSTVKTRLASYEHVVYMYLNIPVKKAHITLAI